MPRLSGAARSSGSEANFAVVLAGSDAIWCKVWHCHESCISGSTKTVRHIFRNCPRVKTLGVEKTFRTPQTVHAYSHRVTLLPLDKRVAVAKRSSPSGRWRTRTKDKTTRFSRHQNRFIPSKPRKTPGKPQGSPSTGGLFRSKEPIGERLPAQIGSGSHQLLRNHGNHPIADGIIGSSMRASHCGDQKHLQFLMANRCPIFMGRIHGIFMVYPQFRWFSRPCLNQLGFLSGDWLHHYLTGVKNHGKLRDLAGIWMVKSCNM